jgi:hypothetical protein
MNSLNSTNEGFIFNFPPDFVPKAVENRYKIFLEDQQLPYGSVVDYLNHTVKEITLPSLTFPTVSQAKMYGKERKMRGSASPYDVYAREFNIVVSNKDSNASYWIFHDCLMLNYTIPDKPFISDFLITILDINRRETFKVYLKEVLEGSLSDLRLAYNQGADHEEKDLTITFSCNFIDIEYVPRYGSEPSDGDFIERYN